MLEWNVYMEDFNNRRIKTHNVFSHGGFLADLKKAARKYRDREREQFEAELSQSLMYWYWCKCEWEIILSDWPPSEQFNKKKVDVYDQVVMNWPVFCDYVWAHRAELRRKEESKE